MSELTRERRRTLPRHGMPCAAQRVAVLTLVAMIAGLASLARSASRGLPPRQNAAAPSTSTKRGRLETLSGRVRDAEKRGVSGATVWALPARPAALQAILGPTEDRFRIFKTRTNRRGLFRLTLPKGYLYRVLAIGPKNARVSILRSGLRFDDRVSLDLLPAASLELVPGPESRTLRKLNYQLVATDRETREDFVLAHGSGEWPLRFPALPPGPYRIRLIFREARSFERSCALLPGRTTKIVAVAEDAARIRFRLKSKAAAPTEALADVEFPPLLRVPGGTRIVEGSVPCPAFGLVVRIGVIASSGLRIDREVGPLYPGRSYVLEATWPRQRSLTLACAPSASPRSMVLLWRESGRIGTRLLTLPARDSSSLVVLKGLPEREVLLLSFGDGGERSATPLRKDAKRLTVPMEAGSSLSASLEMPDGSPARDAMLLCMPITLRTAGKLSELHPPIVRYASRRGEIQVPALVPGEYELEWTAPRCVPVTQKQSLRAGKSSRIHLRFERGARIHGVILGAGRKPAGSVLVTLLSLMEGGRKRVLEGSSDARGRFRFEGLEPGFYRVEARRIRGARSEIATAPRARTGADALELQLVDEDPPFPGKGAGGKRR